MRKIINKIVFSIVILLLQSCNNNNSNTEKNVTNKTTTQDLSVSNQDNESAIKQLLSLGFTTNVGTSYGNPNATKGGEFVDYLTNYPLFRSYGPFSKKIVTISTGTSIIELIYGANLITYNFEKDQWERGLADYWKFSDDGKTLTLRINPNIKFSDGTPLSVDDIIATHEFLLSEDLGDINEFNKQKKYQLTKIDDQLLEIKVNTNEWSVWIDLNFDIMPKAYLSKVTHKEYIENYSSNFMPSLGPYFFDKDKSVKDELIALKRNPNWWGNNYDECKYIYNFDSIVFKIIRENVIAKQLFNKGEIDIFAATPNEWDDEFSKDKNNLVNNNLILKKLVFNSIVKQKTLFIFNTKVKPLDDIKVRKAISLSYDKDTAIEKIYHNSAVKYFSNMPMSKWGSPNVETYNYDVDMASKLLDEAGYNIVDTDGIRKNASNERLEFDVILYGRETNVQTHNILQDNLKRIGVKVNLNIIDYAEVMKNIDNKDFTMARTSLNITQIPKYELEFLSTLADKKGNLNSSGFSNKEIDELIAQFLIEKNINKRYDISHKIDEIISREYIYMHLWYTPYNSQFIHWNKFGESYGYSDFTPEKYWYYDKTKEDKIKEAKNDTSIHLQKESIIADPFHLKPKDYTLYDM